MRAQNDFNQQSRAPAFAGLVCDRALVGGGKKQPRNHFPTICKKFGEALVKVHSPGNFRDEQANIVLIPL